MEITLRKRGEATELVFRGPLTEGSDLPALGELRGQVAMDLSGITRINSAGVGEWMRMIRAIEPGTHVMLERCPVNFMLQVGMIANFLGRAKVMSLYLPYLCPECEAATEGLVEVQALTAKLPPLPPCGACGASLELDVDRDEYLSFLDDNARV